VNPSGGLISKGHPLGATGLAQCAELVWHLRGWANNRLVDGARAALQHNLGLGGAVVVTVYTRADAKVSARVGDAEVAEMSGVGYNPAVVAGGFTEAQARSVRSQERASEWAMGDVGGKILAKF
jgi:sterol carrier protein 2